jgi:hypothetical protein
MGETERKDEPTRDFEKTAKAVGKPSKKGKKGVDKIVKHLPKKDEMRRGPSLEVAGRCRSSPWSVGRVGRRLGCRRRLRLGRQNVRHEARTGALGKIAEPFFLELELSDLLA